MFVNPAELVDFLNGVRANPALGPGRVLYLATLVREWMSSNAHDPTDFDSHFAAYDAAL